MSSRGEWTMPMYKRGSGQAPTMRKKNYANYTPQEVLNMNVSRIINENYHKKIPIYGCLDVGNYYGTEHFNPEMVAAACIYLDQYTVDQFQKKHKFILKMSFLDKFDDKKRLSVDLLRYILFILKINKTRS